MSRSVPSADYSERITRARKLMGTSGLDALLLSVGSDLPYFTGYRAPQLERLTMLVLTQDKTILVIPELEAPRVEHNQAFEVQPWGETKDPVSIVADLAGPAKRAALGDQTWSTFALALQQLMPDTEFVDASEMTQGLRMTKDPVEIELLRSAATAADQVVGRLTEERFMGRTERQIAWLVADITVEEGHDKASDPIVAAGPNSASPHHEPTDRVIEEGDVVVVDFGGTVAGYHSDTSRTFQVGQQTQLAADLHRVVLEAQQQATAAVRPGVEAQQIDRVARQLIVDAGYGEFFIHRTGHGIGLDVHEHPYLVEGNDLALEPGMTFSIEPGIYLPGQFGVRIEDIVAVTEEGSETLNNSRRELYLVN